MDMRVEPRPWNQRQSSLQTFSYGKASLSEVLRCIVIEVRNGVTEDAFPFKKTLRSINSPYNTCMNVLRTIGLISHDSARGWTVTTEGERWLEANDDYYLSALICANVQFTGELLYLLDEPKSKQELFASAKNEYGMRWTGTTQVSERERWFENLGLIERVGNSSYILTSNGREFLKSIDITDPNEISEELKVSEEDSGWFPADWAIDLCKLQIEESTARKSKIPSLDKGKEKLELYSKLISFLETPKTIYEYNEYLKQMGIDQRYFDSFRSDVNRFGLVENVALGYQSTEIAVKWVKGGARPIDLACCVHHRYAFTFEILQELLSGEKSRQELVNLAKIDYGIEIIKEHLASRLHFLALAKLVSLYRDKVGITSYGKKLIPYVLFATDQQSTINSKGDEQPSADLHSGVLRDLTIELNNAAIDSENPERFEIACMKAFEMLGFVVTHFGGSGSTDVLIEGQAGTNASYRIAVEVKTSANYNVDSGIRTDVLKKHREKHGAIHSLVVGTRFGNNTQQQAFASDSDVALLSVDLLCYLLKLHDSVPLNTREYRSLLNSSGLIKKEDIRRIFVPSRHNQCTINMVINTLSKYSEMVSDDSMMTADNIYTAIMFSPNSDGVNDRWVPEVNAIKEACDLLAHPMIGVIKKKDNKYRMLGSTNDLTTKLMCYIGPRLSTDANVLGISSTGDCHG